VVQVWIISRTLLAIVAMWLMASQHIGFEKLVMRWDTQYFARIATTGYAEPNLVAFFPGLPLLLRGLSWTGLSSAVLGVVLALVASAIAATALYRLVGPMGACLWLIAPTAVFTVVPYTEAFFAAAGFWAWERARSNHWLAAGLLCGVACLFRVSGLFLLGGLGLLALSQVWDSFKKRKQTARDLALQLTSRIGWLLIPIAVLVAIWLYFHAVTGSWNAWFEAQSSGWSRGLTWPWESLQHTLEAIQPSAWPGRPEVPWVFCGELISMTFGVATVVVAVVRRHIAEAGYVGIQIFAFATSYWFMSVNRAVLLWFPLFGYAADGLVWTPSKKPVRIVWRTLSILAVLAILVAMMAWAWLFFTGRWSS
jgi:hypothetical protein